MVMIYATLQVATLKWVLNMVFICIGLYLKKISSPHLKFINNCRSDGDFYNLS